MQNNITQLHNLEPQQILNPLEDLKKQIDDLKKNFQPKEPNEYLTRNNVAEMLSIDLSTVHNYTKRKILQAYQIGGRVFYKRQEVENAIVKLIK